MTLKELKTRCIDNGFKYAYGLFKDEVKAPYLIAYSDESNMFHADGKVYFKRTLVKLIYTYVNRNSEEMEKIEDEILGDIVWNKSDENYLENERVWQITYSFYIIGG